MHKKENERSKGAKKGQNAKTIKKHEKKKKKRNTDACTYSKHSTEPDLVDSSDLLVVDPSEHVKHGQLEHVLSVPHAEQSAQHIMAKTKLSRYEKTTTEILGKGE